jgi:hypothetical protein
MVSYTTSVYYVCLSVCLAAFPSPPLRSLREAVRLRAQLDAQVLFTTLSWSRIVHSGAGHAAEGASLPGLSLTARQQNGGA